MSTHLSYYERNLPEVVLGGIPLIRAHTFRNLGQEYWRSRGFPSSYTAANDLERLQRLLHEKGQEKDVSKSECDSDEEEEEQRINSIILESKYKPYRGDYIRNDKIPYHEDILPRWQGTFTAYIFFLVLGNTFCMAGYRLSYLLVRFNSLVLYIYYSPLQPFYPSSYK